MEPSTLQDYRRVAGTYGKPFRNGNLTWSHHRELAAREDRLEWLARTEAGGWSGQWPRL